MAALAIGAMLASAAAGELVSRITSFLQGRYNLNSDVEGKLQRLRELLLEIESVVGAAAGRDIENKKLVEWLRELENLVNQSRQSMHAFKYGLLEKKSNDEDASSFASSSSNPFKRICIAAARYTWLSSNENVSELNSLLERLERTGSRVGNFINLLSLDGQSNKPAGLTGQLPDIPLQNYPFVVYVREKERIVNFLLSTEPCGAGTVPVLPIIGMGGIGKTTLAQVVYNDERVKSHFSLLMWVCVSENFDVSTITREIYEQSGCQASYGSSTSSNILQYILKERLNSEKFLLVLDDVWNETEDQAWDILKALLCNGKGGSKILLTSRLPNVAKLMGTMHPIELEGLTEDEYWSFFKEYAFGGITPEEHPGLVAIGKEIALKMKGSPLAAKTMGQLLTGNLDIDYWESISKSVIWEVEKGQDDIMACLILSYQSLPACLQKCFACLSVYPIDSKFKRESVIQMWIAQGMIQQDSRMKRIENIGEDYFNELVSKSFLQSVEEDCFTMHDLIHDLAEFASKDLLKNRR